MSAITARLMIPALACGSLCAESSSIAGFKAHPRPSSAALGILLHTLCPSGLRMQEVASALGSLVWSTREKHAPVFLFPFTPHPSHPLFRSPAFESVYLFICTYRTLKRAPFGDTNFSFHQWYCAVALFPSSASV